jgi:hypothetical protein
MYLKFKTFVGGKQVRPQKAPCDSTPTPFRLLDLPKELRLMIYEKVQINWNRHAIPLSQHGDTGTLDNASLPGLRILGTCRSVHREASLILRRKLLQILEMPPTILVRADNLAPLANLYDPDAWRQTIVDKLICAIKSRRVVHILLRDRSGKASIRVLRNVLRLTQNRVPNDSTILAFATFILRSHTYLTTSHFQRPQLAIVIRLSPGFTHIAYTFRTTRPSMFGLLWYPHMVTQLYPFLNIVQQFAVVVEEERRKEEVRVDVYLGFMEEELRKKRPLRGRLGVW